MLAGRLHMMRRRSFLLKGALVWLLMPIAAIANGALRDLLLAPLLGVHAAQILAVVVLLSVIYVVTAVFLGRAGHRRGSADLWALGVLWMVLMVAIWHRPLLEARVHQICTRSGFLALLGN